MPCGLGFFACLRPSKSPVSRVIIHGIIADIQNLLWRRIGRSAIEREMAERGLKPLLPTLVPFRSNDWPWKTDPTKGTGPARLEDVP